MAEFIEEIRLDKVGPPFGIGCLECVGPAVLQAELAGAGKIVNGSKGVIPLLVAHTNAAHEVVRGHQREVAVGSHRSLDASECDRLRGGNRKQAFTIDGVGRRQTQRVRHLDGIERMFQEQGSDSAVTVLGSNREQMPVAAEYSGVVVSDDVEIAIKLVAAKDLGRLVISEQVVFGDSCASGDVAAAQKR